MQLFPPLERRRDRQAHQEVKRDRSIRRLEALFEARHRNGHDPEHQSDWLSAHTKCPSKSSEDGKLQSNEQCHPNPSGIAERVIKRAMWRAGIQRVGWPTLLFG